MLAVEGYYKDGGFFALKPLTNIVDNRRVIITILDEPTREKPELDSWGELDKLVAAMPELPQFEDFPREQLGRELASFERV